jgi:hypothetical protein
LTAAIAFTIASTLHVGNAYWAAMPAWGVSQSARGLMLERAAFRILGALLGAATGVAAGVLVALAYCFLLQPTVPRLILSVRPFILVGGLARASSRTAGPALDANMFFMLGSQAVLPAVTNRAVILNEAAALMLAAGLVTTVGFPVALPRALRACCGLLAPRVAINPG